MVSLQSLNMSSFAAVTDLAPLGALVNLQSFNLGLSTVGRRKLRECCEIIRDAVDAHASLRKV
jgi:hypothetical protein